MQTSDTLAYLGEKCRTKNAPTEKHVEHGRASKTISQIGF